MSKKSLSIVLVVVLALVAIFFVADPWLLWSISYQFRRLLEIVGIIAIAALVIKVITAKSK